MSKPFRAPTSAWSCVQQAKLAIKRAENAKSDTCREEHLLVAMEWLKLADHRDGDCTSQFEASAAIS